MSTRSVRSLCVRPFETPPGHPYLAWSFEEWPVHDWQHRLQWTTIPTKRRDFGDKPRDWCGTPAVSENSLRRMRELEREKERPKEAYFETWSPAEVPNACLGLLEPSAIREERYVLPGASGDPASAMLEQCMRKHRVRKQLPLAIEMDVEYGCVKRVKVRLEPRNNAALDQCVAQAYAGQAYLPPSDGGPLIWSTFIPSKGSADVLAAAQELVAVPSRCPTTGHMSSRSVEDNRYRAYKALRATRIFHRCAAEHGSQSLEIAVNFDSRSGHAVGAAAITNPRNAKLDACIAEVLATTCVEPSYSTEPFTSQFANAFGSSARKLESRLALDLVDRAATRSLRNAARVRGGS